MSNSIPHRVSAALHVLLAANESFTILDVTNAVNADGGGEVRHREVHAIAQPILNNIVVGRGYMATAIGVVDPTGRSRQAALYHPISVPATDYQDRQKTIQYANSGHSGSQGQSGGATAVAPAPVAIAAPGLPNARGSRVVKVRSDGAVEIPQALLDIAGFTAGTDVDIIKHPNSVSIVSGTERTVNSNGVRINARTLKECHLGQISLMSASAFSDKIVISK